MKYLDFKTSHYIVLSYPLAGLWRRLMACIIDGLLVYFTFLALLLIIVKSEVLLYVMSTLLFLMYHLTFEIFNRGQSLGKKMMKIRVISLDGGTPSLKSYLIRWSFRMVDIGLTSGTLAMSLIYATSKGQRLGDILAGTTVVYEIHENYNTLSDLEKMQSKKKEIMYTKLSQFDDTDMLLVKQMISRYKQNPTPENRDLLVKLANKISESIDDTGTQTEALEFLQKVLSDYIILTR